MKLHRDGLIRLYVLAVVLAFAASWPATYTAISRFHGGDWFGLVSNTAILVLLEGGAIAAAVAAVFARDGRDWLIGYKWAAVGATALANGVSGYAYGAASGLSGLALWGGCLVYAAMVSAVLALALHLLVGRVRFLKQLPPVAVERRVAQMLAPLQEAQVLYQEMGRMVDAMRQPMPALTVIDPKRECPTCGHVWKDRQEYARAHNAAQGCPACKTILSRIEL
jgi:hypothetical protein